jgi:hypothetical protein
MILIRNPNKVVVISGCGVACSECILYLRNKCRACTRENRIASHCVIFQCLDEKKIQHCLLCDAHKGCKKRYNAMGKCPL